MPKSPPQPDVLVLGDHPSAYLAAALLRGGANPIKVAHAVIPGEQMIDRLVMVNPALFELHEILAPLKRKLDLSAVYGLKFLADDPSTSITHVGKTIAAHVGCYKPIRAAMRKLAEDARVSFHEPGEMRINHLDENGAEVVLDKTTLRPRLLVVAGELPVEQKRMIGQPIDWDAEVPHRYTFLKLKGAKWHDGGAKPVIPMSLDVHGTLNWAWLLPGLGMVQVAVECRVHGADGSGADGVAASMALLNHWINVLVSHGALKTGSAPIDVSAAVSMELPLAGALSQEGVANRTLLIGPAGGFYTACAEDIYPNCWSAVCAAEVVKKALNERHVQDALSAYRQSWGATLGDYLRGPQQNLRFLLPLVYRNGMMTARLTEAILSGKSVVR